jgi:glycosyltransferase involved in cell wall biosynthesis
MAQKLSVCLMVRDEEKNLPACLESVKLADEIVVVDSGSRDRTVEIARGFGARVIHREWPGNVAQRRYSVGQATHDWTLYVDADERATPALQASIRAVLEKDGDGRDGFWIGRKLFYCGRWIEHGGWYPEWQVRLFRRSKARVVGIDPHDRLLVDGPTGRLAGDLLHYSFRDLSHQVQVMDRYTGMASRDLAGHGRRFRRLRDLALRPFVRFFTTYVLRLGFMDGVPGFLMAVNHAYAGFMKYARLWEIERGLAPGPAARSPGPAPTLASEPVLPAPAEGKA